MTTINYCTAQYNPNQSKDDNAKIARMTTWKEVETSELQPLVENHTHSPHVWDGRQVEANCIRTHGIIIDFDNDDWTKVGKLTVQAVQAILDEFETHIYSSQSHLRIKKAHEDDGEVERFHAYIPFDKPIEHGDYICVFNHFNQLFNGRIDQGCKDLARLAFPSTDNPNKFYEYHPGRKFDWETDAYLGQERSVIEEPKSNKKKAVDNTFTLDTKVRMAKDARGRAHYLPIKEIDQKSPIYCPFCDDEESEGPSAFISFNGKGIPFISCSHCRAVGGKGTYWLTSTETQMLLDKANGLVTFSPMKESGTWILYPDGILARKEEKHIRTHFLNNGLFPPYDFDTYDIIRDYSTDDLFIHDHELSVPLINVYKAPSVLHTEADSSIVPDRFPIINNLLNHLFPVPEERDWFEQWLSEVVRRKRMRTTFLILGVPGTGKNLFFEQVVGNIVGKNNTVTITNDLIKKEFNTYLREGVFYIFDEVAVDKKDRIQVREKIKRYITNDNVPIEGKGTNSQNGYRMTGNSVFLSNNDIPMQIDDPDRRFNVIKTKNTKIIEEPWYKQDLTPDILMELPVFVAYLKAKSVTIDVCNSTINNEEKRRLQDAVKSIVLKFWEALRDCDDGFFIDNRTPLRRWENDMQRLPFEQQDNMGRNIFRMQMQDWKKVGGITFSEIQDLVYRTWGENPPGRISMTSPPPGFKHTTTSKFGHGLEHLVKYY